MELIAMLVIIVSILTLLSGLTVFLGSEKFEKKSAFMFLLASIFAAIWSFLTIIFLISQNDDSFPAVKFVSFDWFYIFYASILGLMLVCFIISAVINKKRTASGLARKGKFFYVISLLVAGALIIVFDLVLPLFSDYRAMWIGPLVLSAAVIVHFYAVLRYQLLFLSNIWLKIGSYVILVSVAAMIYMVVFFMVFSLLFKVQKLDIEIVLMNFIMILIMLLILPVFHEASGLMRSLIYTQDINMAYITKKLNLMATKSVKMGDLATFLSSNLHFKYIGFVIDKKVYGSSRKTFSEEELADISMLDSEKDSVWQKPTGHVKTTFSKKGIVAVAELKNAKGRPFGQIIVGEPAGKGGFEKRDLEKLDMVINLVASIIDSEKRLRA